MSRGTQVLWIQVLPNETIAAYRIENLSICSFVNHVYGHRLRPAGKSYLIRPDVWPDVFRADAVLVNIPQMSNLCHHSSLGLYLLRLSYTEHLGATYQAYLFVKPLATYFCLRFNIFRFGSIMLLHLGLIQSKECLIICHLNLQTN